MRRTHIADRLTLTILKTQIANASLLDLLTTKETKNMKTSRELQLQRQAEYR